MAATLPQPVFVHQCDGHILLRLVQDKAVVPPALLQQLLASRVEAAESEQGRMLKKKGEGGDQEDILATLLPHAYTKRTSTYLVVSAVQRLDGRICQG